MAGIRRPSAFKRTDVKRAVEAVHDAGLTVGRVEIEGGKITIVPGGPVTENDNLAQRITNGTRTAAAEARS